MTLSHRLLVVSWILFIAPFVGGCGSDRGDVLANPRETAAASTNGETAKDHND